ncbi:Maf family protein [Abyssibacter profundi]|uniref:dTTP/UTP pyrophosphatase n=1 Tax=Abyssibacter profundi TaxID=2182787 RepID=A0A363UNH1_9GAMM|nr:Maf family protein [Abyssibacter profundi]PWN56987.1 hypothetical protein DEH80_03345 [Abyssibacter profundi]
MNSRLLSSTELPDIDFYLASGSPRRRELLAQAGYRFAVEVSNVDETADIPEADVLVVALAERKAAAVAERVEGLVLAADTVVEIDGDVLGKPRDAADAAAMLRRMSGRSHRVLSGVALAHADGIDSLFTVTAVEMDVWSEADIEAYWRSGEPDGKAGAYAIQGIAGGWVKAIEGSYTGVVGLPMAETRQLLAAHGVTAVCA